jgi:hypothetical protein
MNSVKKNCKRRAPEKALEYSGDWVCGNYWVKVGLTNSQVRAITRLGKRWSIRKAPCATMARYLISLALLNPEETQSKLEALTKYVEAEGFNSLGSYCDRVMRAQEKLARR